MHLRDLNRVRVSYSQFGFGGTRLGRCRGSNTARVYVGLLPVVEAFVVVAVPGRVGEVRVPADEPEAVNLDRPGFGLLIG